MFHGIIRPKTRRFLSGGGGGGGGFSTTSQQSTDFLTRVAAAGVTLTTARKTLYDTMITSIVNTLGGNTASHDWPSNAYALWLLADPDGSGTTARQNLVSAPGSNGANPFSPTLTVNGTGGSFVTDKGWSGGGAAYLGTGMAPIEYVQAAYGFSSTLHDMAFMSFLGTSRAAGSGCTFGMTSQGFLNTYIQHRANYGGPDLLGGELYGNAYPTMITPTDSKSAVTLTRRSPGTSFDLIVNGAYVNTYASDNSSFGNPGDAWEMYIGTYDNYSGGSHSISPGDYETGIIPAIGVFTGLTNAQAIAVQNAVNTFLAGLPTPFNVY